MDNPFAVSKHPSVLRSIAREKRVGRNRVQTPAEKIAVILQSIPESERVNVLKDVVRKVFGATSFWA